jgi:hypothetical protein
LESSKGTIQLFSIFVDILSFKAKYNLPNNITNNALIVTFINNEEVFRSIKTDNILEDIN